ncbi:MAG TPA: BCCT family transporter [Bacillota bacterium]|nr:BCCT family transporter [Bacillota bacterium]
MKKITNVFWISVAIILVMVLFGTFSPQAFENATQQLQTFITDYFSWYYLILVAAIVIFCGFFIFNSTGSIRLGKPDDRPEYSTATWFAMLFSAGMGIGLVFWGAAEPLSHYITPPIADGETPEAYKEALKYTFFHWGIHAWAIYAVVGLGLAYFQFRKGSPGLISSTLKPIFGNKMDGLLGNIIDILAVTATVIGVATTLGFGAKQINGGLSYLFGISISFPIQLIIVIIVTVLFIISAWSGIGKGIKYLSNTNLVLAVVLFGLVFVLGPTILMLNLFTDSFGQYVTDIVRMSFRSAPLNSGGREWINDWTVFYWAWWIAWSPFVGIFIARISKGRTIREFLVGVTLVPAVIGFLWFTVFGTSAIEVQKKGMLDLGALETEEVLFAVFSQFPWATILSIIALALIVTFFITSADSATFVLGMQTTNGSLTPPNQVKITWGVAQSAVAIILLYSGGLDALQNILIIAAFPFSLIIILMMVSLYRSLMEEKRELQFNAPSRRNKG